MPESRLKFAMERWDRERLLEQLFGSDCQVVTTLVCGDNYAVENQDAVTVRRWKRFALPMPICSSPGHAS